MTRGALMAALAVGAVLRCGFVLGYPQLPVVDDAASYHDEAKALATGQWHHRPATARFEKGPVYPLFLAAAYRLSGADPIAARVAQAVVSTGVIALLYVVGCAAFNTKVGILAAGLGAIYPPFIAYAGLLLTETVSAALLLGFGYAVLRAWQRPTATGWWLIAGGLGGVAVLHRKELLAIVAATVLLFALWRVGWRRLGLMVAAATAVVLPWMWHVHAQTGQWTVAVAPTTAQVLWLAVVDTGQQEWDATAPHMRRYAQLTAGLSAAEAERAVRREALRLIRTQPLEYARRCAWRLAAFWIGGHSQLFKGLEASLVSVWQSGEYGKAVVKLGLLMGNLAVISLGLTGMYLAWHSGLVDPRAATLLALPIGVKTVIHTMLFSALRYQVPIMGFLLVFAAFTLWHLRRLARELRLG